MNKFKRLSPLFCLLFVVLFYASSNAQTADWTEIYPGIWKAIVGKPEAYDLLKASGAQPNKDALSKTEKVSFPFSIGEINLEVNSGKTFLRFPLQKEEQLYGFGLNFQSVHQRGKILELH